MPFADKDRKPRSNQPIPCAIREVRRAMNLSAAELADRMACSRVAVYQYENEIRKARPDFLIKLLAISPPIPAMCPILNGIITWGVTPEVLHRASANAISIGANAG